MNKVIKLINWNIDWASPRSRKTPVILERLEACDPEVVCFTEARSDFAELLLKKWSGNIVYSPARRWREEWPSKIQGHKVLLWSKQAWREEDRLGSAELPEGRFVSGQTQTPLGEVTVIGVCIPYSFSRHKSHGLEKWQDHEGFLVGLKKILNQKARKHDRLVLIGDFNQWLMECSYYSESHRPARIKEALLAILDPEFQIVTDKLKDTTKDRANIDHIAITSQLAVRSVDIIDSIYEGRELSKNHFGVAADIASA